MTLPPKKLVMLAAVATLFERSILKFLDIRTWTPKKRISRIWEFDDQTSGQFGEKQAMGGNGRGNGRETNLSYTDQMRSVYPEWRYTGPLMIEVHILVGDRHIGHPG